MRKIPNKISPRLDTSCAALSSNLILVSRNVFFFSPNHSSYTFAPTHALRSLFILWCLSPERNKLFVPSPRHVEYPSNLPGS